MSTSARSPGLDDQNSGHSLSFLSSGLSAPEPREQAVLVLRTQSPWARTCDVWSCTCDLCSPWSVGGVAPGHLRADKLRRPSPSQALCPPRKTHRLLCRRAQTMCSCYDSETHTQLSEPPAHPLLLASPGQAPAASLTHRLPASYQHFFFF